MWSKHPPHLRCSRSSASGLCTGRVTACAHGHITVQSHLFVTRCDWNNARRAMAHAPPSVRRGHVIHINGIVVDVSSSRRRTCIRLTTRKSISHRRLIYANSSTPHSLRVCSAMTMRALAKTVLRCVHVLYDVPPRECCATIRRGATSHVAPSGVAHSATARVVA